MNERKNSRRLAREIKPSFFLFSRSLALSLSRSLSPPKTPLSLSLSFPPFDSNNCNY